MADSPAVQAEKPRSTAKRDKLRKIELEMQKQWADAKIYEADPIPGKEKFLVTFPYPYMNGCLHLGHAFTVTKAEFAARYEKLKGKNALFPFGFHCTGMPIKACADKLKQEIELYGNPPKFPVVEEEVAPEPTEKEEEAKPAEPTPAAAAPKKKEDPTAFHGKKAKVSQKGAGKKKKTYQWDIMLSLGLKPEEIPAFANPLKWLEYFPPVGKQDLQAMGVAVDWRRSFITTDANPYYDSFVRWQFETLRARNKLGFGKRYSVYSPLDGQACADHERSEGEGVGPQEYVCIKLQLARPYHIEQLKKYEDRDIFFVAGTLRPETMYGQTNCWIHPDITYGAFEVNQKGDIFICTQRAARNMAFQELSKEPEKVSCLAEISGKDLIGAPLHAPLSKYDVVYTLPMLTISPDKGTGVVTSVPSDSPDDYMNFMTLKTKPEYRKKIGVKDEWVEPFELIPILTTPEYGDMAAEVVCKQLKIKSPNDKALLEQAKELTYMKGFYNGEMTVGPYKGQKVKDAKTLVRDKMIADGQAVMYAEPAGLVVSRSGDECVVALLDQWYLKYGEAEWRDLVEKHLAKMELYHSASKETLSFALGWMSQWACSRSFGLGTRLPWDPKYLIESLSDSTIYMAYYSVAYLLQGGELNGQKPGPLGIKPDQMTQQVWDYIFLKAELPKDSTIPKESLEKLRAQFEYWYPMDLRVSGKDLLQNHLLFCLYNHAAIFPPEQNPKAIRANGHLLINNEKMAKSTGNFLTLQQAIEKFSADGMRIALADAGDAVDDANFLEGNADSALLRLHTQLAWIEEVLAGPLADGTTDSFQDRVFLASINKSIKETDLAYSRAVYHEALVKAFWDLLAARDLYRTTCETLNVPMNRASVLRFVEVQALLLSPIAPHFSDHLWREILHKDGFIWSHGSFPVAQPVDSILMAQNEYIEAILAAARIAIRDFCDPVKQAKKTKAKGPLGPINPPTEAEIILAKEFPEWTIKTYEVLNTLYDGTKFPEMDTIVAELLKVSAIEKNKKKAMAKVAGVVAAVAVSPAGVKPEALRLMPPFDEKSLIDDRFAYIQKSMKLEKLTVRFLDVADEKILPGTPGFAILKN